MRLLYIVTIILLMSSCNNSTKEQTSENWEQVDEIKVTNDQETVSPNYNEKDSVISDSQIKTINTDNKKRNNKLPEIPPPIRYIEFPGDDNFNGKPITQQENIPKAILEQYPDTLSKLAIVRYKTYDHFFPKSIGDNFEEGISTEHIHYPQKLIFRFELFENESSWTSYIVKEIIVKRNPNGELYTE